MTHTNFTDRSYVRECELLRAHSQAMLWSDHLHRRAVIADSSGVEVSAEEANKGLADARAAIRQLTCAT